MRLGRVTEQLQLEQAKSELLQVSIMYARMHTHHTDTCTHTHACSCTRTPNAVWGRNQLEQAKSELLQVCIMYARMCTYEGLLHASNHGAI